MELAAGAGLFPKLKPVEVVDAEGAAVADVAGAAAPKLKPVAAAVAAAAAVFPRAVTFPAVIVGAGKTDAKPPPNVEGTGRIGKTAAGAGRAAAVGRERPEVSFQREWAGVGAWETARENPPCAREGTGPTIGAPSCAGVGCCGCELAMIRSAAAGLDAAAFGWAKKTTPGEAAGAGAPGTAAAAAACATAAWPSAKESPPTPPTPVVAVHDVADKSERKGKRKRKTRRGFRVVGPMLPRMRTAV